MSRASARRGFEIVNDQLRVPMATRLARLGHANTRTTMKYTRLLTDDGRQVPELLDEYFWMVDEIEG
jgi:hypothetical protein